MYKITEKIFDRLLRLPRFTAFAVLALAFVYSGMFGSMQLASYTAQLLGVNINIYAAVIIFGLLQWLVFELIAAVYFWVVRSMMYAAEINRSKPAMANILRWFFVIVNIISGSLRLCYFKWPLAVPLMENVLIFAVQTAALVLYYFYIRKKYIAPQLYPRSVAAFCAPYLIFLVVNMLTSFML